MAKISIDIISHTPMLVDVNQLHEFNGQAWLKIAANNKLRFLKVKQSIEEIKRRIKDSGYGTENG